LQAVRRLRPGMTLGVRLRLGFGIVLTLLALIGGVGWAVTSALNTWLKAVLHDDCHTN
jgi:hypothetical protein